VEKPILVFAHVVQHLPFREATQPAVVLPEKNELKGPLRCHVILTYVENLPSFEVFRFPVCFEQLLELFACQGIRPGVGMLLEDLLKLFRNEPGVVDDIWLEILYIGRTTIRHPRILAEEYKRQDMLFVL
jgi:hypothetical protein